MPRAINAHPAGSAKLLQGEAHKPRFLVALPTGFARLRHAKPTQTAVLPSFAHKASARSNAPRRSPNFADLVRVAAIAASVFVWSRGVVWVIASKAAVQAIIAPRASFVRNSRKARNNVSPKQDALCAAMM